MCTALAVLVAQVIKGEAVSFVGPRDWKSFTAIGHNVSYPLACEAHPEHPAEFKGFTPRKTVNKDKKNNKKSASAAGNATKKSTGKKTGPHHER